MCEDFARVTAERDDARAEVERLRADYASAARLLSDAEYRVDDLRAIIDGRTTAPTDEEIRVHSSGGGR